MYRSRIPVTKTIMGRDRLPSILLTHKLRTVRHSPTPVTPTPTPVTPKPKPMTPRPQRKKRPSIKKPPPPSRIRMKKNFEAMRKKLKDSKLRLSRKISPVNTTITNLFKALENAPNKASARKIYLKGSLKLHPDKGGNENTFKRFKNVYMRKA